MSQVSGLYDGVVTHQRLTPRRHRLRYRLFQLLLDLDELPALGRDLRLFGHNRFGLFSLHERDHLAGDGRTLRAQVEAMLRGAGIEHRGGPIRLLCLPRVLGYVFNPLSVFYCHRPSGELAAVVLEVNNTFGERHCYVVEATGGEVVRRGCAKTFFVSPFLSLDMTYDFRLAVPGEHATTAILGRGPDGAPIIAAAFSGARRDLTDRALGRAFFSHPLLTLKVVAAIHWEALKLLAKGVRLQPRPVRPAREVTVVRDEAEPLQSRPIWPPEGQVRPPKQRCHPGRSRERRGGHDAYFAPAGA